MPERCHRRTTCRLCGGQALSRVLSLAPTPPANAFVSEDSLSEPQQCYPLDVFLCRDCAHGQLLDVVDPSVLFEDYVYVSGTSPVFVEHFSRYAESIIRRFQPAAGGLVLDIGSNDGTLLRFFGEAGYRTLGVDPAREIARKANEAGIETMVEFFTSRLAQAIGRERGPAQVITANNVFAHADDLADVTRGIKSLLAPAGVFAAEVSYLVDVVEKTLFDTIYHEHLSYHTVAPLQRFLSAQGLELIEAIRIATHGGSIRFIAQHAGGPYPVGQTVGEALELERDLGFDTDAPYRALERRISTLKSRLGELLGGLKADGATIAGFGAPAKATTLMYHFGIGPQTIDFIVDDSPWKQGLYTPGLHIPVLPAAAIYERKPDYVIILAWNFAPAIMEKHAGFRQAGGHFIVPIPEIEVH